MRFTKKRKNEGFSLIEVLVGIAIVAVAMLGLAQLFTYSVMTNSRAERMSNATFLAQQQIDYHRSLTSDELNVLTAGTNDEQIDVNIDGSIDYRRLTNIQMSGVFWQIRVLVFSAEQVGTALADLVGDPQAYDVKADVSTIISR